GDRPGVGRSRVDRQRQRAGGRRGEVAGRGVNRRQGLRRRRGNPRERGGGGGRAARDRSGAVDVGPVVLELNRAGRVRRRDSGGQGDRLPTRRRVRRSRQPNANVGGRTGRRGHLL